MARGLALVTGATGLVGHHIAAELLRRGREVRCLVRDLDRARPVVPPGAELVAGDVTDETSVHRAVESCRVVFHAAGLPEQWLRDAGTFDRVNRGGTEVVGEAALAAGVERFVFTSTIDVFRGGKGERYDETMLDPQPKGTHYERSKQAADRWVAAAIDRGLPAVFVHPGAVYGPGPAASPGTNQFFLDLKNGKVPALLPGGMPVVFAPDLGRGHVLAEGAAVGSRFILVDRYYSMQELAAAMRDACGSKVPRTLPRWLARTVSGTGEALAKITRRPPLLPGGQLHFLLWGAHPSSDRAQKELGWHPTPLAEGLAATLTAQETS